MSATVAFLMEAPAHRVRHRFTERLFFGRYGFRIGCSGAWLDTAARGGNYQRGGVNRLVRCGSYAQVAPLVASAEARCAGDWLVHRGHARLDVYLAERDDWQTLIDQHGGLIRALWAPRDAAELALMQADTGTLVRDRLFYQRYARRVCFRTGTAALADQVHAWCQVNLVDRDGQRRAAWSRRPLRIYTQNDCDTVLVRLRFAPHILRVDQVMVRSAGG